MSRIGDILSLSWMYPSDLTRQETFNRFVIFVLAVLLVCVGVLTIAFIVQRQEILDRRARADMHTQQWQSAMDAYNKSKQGKGNDQNTGKGTDSKNQRHDESRSPNQDGRIRGQR